MDIMNQMLETYDCTAYQYSMLSKVYATGLTLPHTFVTVPSQELKSTVVVVICSPFFNR